MPFAKARERDAKIRRSIQERAEKEKARREIAEMTKQVYEEVRLTNQVSHLPKPQRSRGLIISYLTLHFPSVVRSLLWKLR